MTNHEAERLEKERPEVMAWHRAERLRREAEDNLARSRRDVERYEMTVAEARDAEEKAWAALLATRKAGTR